MSGVFVCLPSIECYENNIICLRDFLYFVLVPLHSCFRWATVGTRFNLDHSIMAQ